MANVLRMVDQAAIIALWQRGWSQRRIARETGFDRSTVARYVRLERAGRRPKASRIPGTAQSKTAISTPGSVPRDGPDGTTTASSKPAISTPGSEGGPGTVAGRQSLCESVREIIEPKLEAGLSAQRIWQDLTSEHGFEGSYQSVKRFCRRVRSRLPLPFRRMECEPGIEAQVRPRSRPRILLATSDQAGSDRVEVDIGQRCQQMIAAQCTRKEAVLPQVSAAALEPVSPHHPMKWRFPLN